jgi:hypothetical protein
MIVHLGLVIEMRNGKLATSDLICCRKCAPDVMLQGLNFSRDPGERDTLALFNFAGSSLSGTFEERLPPVGYCKDSLCSLPMRQVSFTQTV